MVKNVSILGSTGSIGRQSLDIISRLDVQVAALTAGTSAQLMAEQCRQFRPVLAVMSTKQAAEELKELIENSRKADARIIFIQQEFDQRNAQLIARELNLNIVPINPLSYDWDKEMIHVAKALKNSP